MTTCTAEFTRLADEFGGIACAGGAVVRLRNPFTLDSWTMPVVEATLVLGAVAFLWHALRRYRTAGDPSTLIVWISGVVALVLIEPIAYFPQWFGLERTMGLIFVHNEFTVQFLWGRLPLYIVAMYPFFGCLAWELVRQTGVLRRSHPVVAAATVAVVFHVFYELVDMLGVQYRWWVWNTELSTSRPALGVVPLVNIQAFTVGLPFAIALCTVLGCRRRSPGVRGVARAVVLVSLGVWPLVVLSSAPATLLSVTGLSMGDARVLGTWLLIGVVAVLAVVAVVRAGPVEGPDVEDRSARWTPVAVGSAYVLVVVGILWTPAVGPYLRAVDARTADGAPVGSLPYAAACLVVALGVLALVAVRTRRAATPAQSSQSRTAAAVQLCCMLPSGSPVNGS